jgi:acetyl-CoA C-acetyltransferase
MNGFYDADGQLPCQIDGGLEAGPSGHRAAHALREYLQLQAAPAPASSRTHDRPDPQPGGAPTSNVCSVAIVGALGT